MYCVNLCHCGGIGRRDGFKIHLGQLSVGSSPTSGTIVFKLFKKIIVFEFI